MRYSQQFSRILKVSVAALAIVPSLAFAQDADKDKDTDEKGEEIVVTGTLLRSGGPVGSNVVTLGADKIAEVGAMSSNELLGSLPQVTNFFNNVPLADLSIAVNQVQVARPRIRGIGNAVSATSPTLVLFNGHRIAGAGVTESSTDPDLIPASAIERTDVMTEGGSATYGADAVAGVINIITLRRFDGVKIGGSFGIADNYKQWSINGTVGKDWGSGSAFVSYSYDYNGSLFGRDRGFARNLSYAAQPYVGANFTCAKPNLTLSTLLVSSVGGAALGTFNTVPYAAPNFAVNTANRCDNSENATLVPKSKRHGAVFGLTQELDDSTSINFHAFYGQRNTEARSEATGVVQLGAGNPYGASVASAGLVVGGPLGGAACPIGNLPAASCTFFGFPFENRALVQFSFSPAIGDSPLTQTVGIKEWGADLELTHDFSKDWQFKQLVAYSQSDSRFNLQSVSTTRLAAAGNGTTATTAINPFNIGAANQTALIANLIDNELAGQTKDRFIQIRGILEGRLLTLPGGDVRLAVGYEYQDEVLNKRQQTDIARGTLGAYPFVNYKRSIISGFGELRVPLVGSDNAMPGIQSLTLSAAGRWDHYSDFGSTTNPKLGITYEPVAGLRLRGNWGKSFTAPNSIDQLGGLFSVIGVSQNHPFQPTGIAPPANSYDVIIQGSVYPLKPQTATTWSVGADLDAIKGLHLSGNYYVINYRNQLGIPTPGPAIFTDFPATNFVSATGVAPATVTSFTAQIPDAAVQAQVATLLASGAKFYSLIDFRTGNFYTTKLSGVDFSASYSLKTGFGSVDASLYGNVPLTQSQQNTPAGPFDDKLAIDRSLLSLQIVGGVNIGSFRGQATWNHTGGYKITPTNSVPVQNRVNSFNTIDLFFKYNVPVEAGILKDLSFTLNVRNLLDQDPPVYFGNSGSSNGYANGFTLGRMFILGATKKF